MKFPRQLLAIGRIPMVRYLSVIALFVTAILLDDNYSPSYFNALKEKEQQLRSEIDGLKERIREDSMTIEKIQNDPKTLERIAREKYLMKRPNEDVFIIKESE